MTACGLSMGLSVKPFVRTTRFPPIGPRLVSFKGTEGSLGPLIDELVVEPRREEDEDDEEEEEECLCS